VIKKSERLQGAFFLTTSFVQKRPMHHPGGQSGRLGSGARVDEL